MTGLQEIYAIGRVAEEEFEAVLVLRILLEIFFRHLLTNTIFLGRIDKSNTGALEASTAKATAIDALRLTQNLVEGNQFGRATLVVVH